MSHSFEGPNGTAFMFNPDLSEVLVRVRTAEMGEVIEEDEWGATVRLDGDDLVAFIAAYVRRERIAAIEDASISDLLGVPYAEPVESEPTVETEPVFTTSHVSPSEMRSQLEKYGLPSRCVTVNGSGYTVLPERVYRELLNRVARAEDS